MSDIRENLTLDCVATIFGHEIFVEPFLYEEQREVFIARLLQALGITEDE